MPHFDIVKESDPSKSFRAANIRGMFDFSSDSICELFSGDISLPDKWNIGVIVGRSGTGKSTIARDVFNKSIDCFCVTHEGKSVIDDFPDDMSTKEITAIMNSVGFSSPPSWLKPYCVLSNGEKMRVDLAIAIASGKSPIVFDEFTSVVDRDVAMICSAAVSKSVRRSNKQFVAVTCHYDIIDWLEPDWVFCTDDMQQKKKTIIDQKSTWSFASAQEKCGIVLGNITI